MRSRNRHLIDIIFALSLFCLFTISGLVAVILGADVYKDITDKTTENYNLRTSLIYLGEKVRTGDSTEALSIKTVDGNDALVISETVGDARYETWFFVSNGSLREVTLSEGVTAKAGDGQAVFELSEFKAEYLNENLIKITVQTASGDTRSLILSLRCQ